MVANVCSVLGRVKTCVIDCMIRVIARLRALLNMLPIINDLRYSADSTKKHNELGWIIKTKFKDGIKKNQWYFDNKLW